MFRLGQLDGALRHCTPATRRIFAGKVLRSTLVSALRQEGHAFTDLRFQAWFAGLATLSDTPARHARSPRAMGDAILMELTHSAWQDLAGLAARLIRAFLAPRDLDTDNAHEAALDVIAQARVLISAGLASHSSSPLASLERLHHDLATSVTFARAEPVPTQSLTGRRSGNVEPAASPRWAVEMLAGEWLHRQGALPFPIPLPDLIRLNSLSGTASEARQARAAALESVARQFSTAVADCARLAASPDKALELRSTSRAPALFELLAGFGAMRSTQLETVIGASRLGVRGMLDTLLSAGMVERTKVAGAYLFDAAHPSKLEIPSPEASNAPAFSTAALDEYDASLADLDRLLDNKHDR